MRIIKYECLNGGLKKSSRRMRRLNNQNGGIYWRYAVLFLYHTHPPNILRSKKAITHRRDITAMSMNCQII